MDSSRKKYTILIVEDEKPLLAALTDTLRRAGFLVIQARNGQAGLDRALKEHPDVILLDIIMPVMDGMTMLNHLRNDAWGNDVEVLLLTNLNEPEKVSNALEKKVQDYLVKSDWKIKDIVKKVNEKLGGES